MYYVPNYPTHTAKYCPIDIGYLCTCVIGLGRSGVWRILNNDYAKNSASSCDMDGTKVFQPEENGFFLFELLAGS